MGNITLKGIIDRLGGRIMGDFVKGRGGIKLVVGDFVKGKGGIRLIVGDFVKGSRSIRGIFGSRGGSREEAVDTSLKLTSGIGIGIGVGRRRWGFLRVW